jgi:type I restriction enzyme S subunit
MSDLVPEYWSNKKLSEVGRCVRGLTYSPDDVSDNGLLVLRSSNVQESRLVFNDNVYVSLDIDEDFMSQKNDIVICVRNGSKKLIGKSAIVKNEGMNSTHGAFMSVFRSDQNSYVQHLFKSDSFFQFVSRDIGATINSINNGNLLNYNFLFPPLPEQQKIAAILSSVDEVIEKTQTQINKLKDLKTGMMQELLSPREGQAANIHITQGESKNSLHHTEFKDSPLGRIPVGWEVEAISSLCTDVVDCVNKTAPVVDYPTPYKMIRTTNVRHGLVDTENVRFVTKETYDTWTRRMLPIDGDLIFTREAPVGECGILRNSKGIFLGQRTMMYRTDPTKVGSHLLMYSLQSDYCQAQIEDFSGGSTVAHMRVPDCGKILIKVPPLAEQAKISAVIGSVVDSIEIKQFKLLQLKNTKKALMQDLLTGKVRVKVDAA